MSEIDTLLSAPLALLKENPACLPSPNHSFKAALSSEKAAFEFKSL